MSGGVRAVVLFRRRIQEGYNKAEINSKKQQSVNNPQEFLLRFSEYQEAKPVRKSHRSNGTQEEDLSRAKM